MALYGEDAKGSTTYQSKPLCIAMVLRFERPRRNVQPDSNRLMYK